MKSAEVGRSLPKQNRNIAVESALEVRCADDMSEFYKISMVRMPFDKRLTNIRMYRSKALNGRNVVLCSTEVCGVK